MLINDNLLAYRHDGEKGHKPVSKIYYCPIVDTECPYYKDGFCTIGNPEHECDDYAYYHAAYKEDDNE